MVQEDIDKIKNEISGLIAHCDKSESEKEEQLTNDCIHDDIDYKPIQFRTKVEKDEILEEGKDDEQMKVGIKDFIVLGCLIAAVIASIVFLFLL